ncbi:AAA domain-containing protein [Baia soyae]|uniref:AAA domain-containing protein n=1 Tax=Baia soyae TaxID=1544746 RepID=A0A4R2RCE2_9BACL|nr:AAA domain-containing protein [Baia soyae]TCP61052.1 AAA domain-containing protein [Baia soyae]
MVFITKELIQYWKGNIDESGFLDIEEKYIKSLAQITYDEMVEGKINDPSVRQKITGNADAKDVFICPALYTTKSRNSSIKPKYHIWLVIPAEITYDGRIQAKNKPPFIPRKYLRPSSQKCTISDVDTVNQYWSDHPFQNEQSKSWESVLKESEHFFDHVLDNPISSFHLLPYKKVKEKVLILDGTKSSNSGSVYNVKKFYEKMLDKSFYKNALKPLAQQYIQIEEPTEDKQLTDSITYSVKHLGQMSTEHGLTISQREALHHFLALQNGELLSIEGPPGTGKTTLLQSVIASLWVNSAYQQQATPSTILASGSTNLSITNILDMFQRISFPSDLPSHSLFDRAEQLTERWIPNVNSLGTFCAAESKRNYNYQLLLRDKQKFEFVNWPNLLQLDQSKIDEWEQHFLARTSLYFNRKITYIERARATLHDALRQAVRMIEENLQEKIDYQLLFTKRDKLFAEYHATSFDEVIQPLSQRANSHKQQVQTVETARRELYHRISNRNPLVVWCSKIPILGKYITKGWSEENQYLLQKQLPDTAFHSYEETILKTELERLEQDYQSQLRLSEEDLLNVQTLQQQWHRNETTRTNNQERWANLSIPDTLAEAEAFFDKTYRVLAFLLATHYWEARFIETAKQRVQSEQPFKNLRQFYAEVAMLTPCLISTLHSAPKFFNENYQYLHEFADLLIIDEASQVLPELAFPVFALAKKALVVGDTNQLPPISNLTADQDNISLQESGLLEITPHVDHLHVCSKSNVMKLANRLTRYVNVQEKPFMLQEHFRCHPKIAQSFNHVYYHNKLHVKTRKKNEYHLLPMAFLHVEGHEEPTGSSRINHNEAATIALWVDHFFKQNKLSISTNHQTLAILTPFSAQANLISSYLKEIKFNVDCIKVGTVHSLQGAEYEVVLFSPTYSTSTSEHFFDRQQYVLNVAISRAKQSFIIFGNKSHFGTHSETPSGKLLPFFEDGTEKIWLPDDMEVMMLTEQRTEKLKQYIREGKVEYTKIEIAGNVTGGIVGGTVNNTTIHNK